MASEYERIRLKNIEDNKRVLAQLGLLNPFKPLPKVVKRPLKRKRVADEWVPEKTVVLPADNKSYGSVYGVRRKSSRLQGKDPGEVPDLPDDVDEDGEQEARPAKPVKRENTFGAIEGVDVGTFWETRMECSRAGIHRPTVAGIHGGEEGCYSIALSGGYDDNIDLGECFTYTGEGGRDLKGTKANPKNLRTAPQSKDQCLSRGNLALTKNVENGHPVRVIRGYKLQGHSPYAPEYGYRYDGLYTVEKAWYTTGVSGFGVWKFAMKRLPNQAPPPWDYVKSEDDMESPMGSQDSGFGSEADSEHSKPNSPGPESPDGSDTNSEVGSSASGNVEDGDNNADSDNKKEQTTVVEDSEKDQPEDKGELQKRNDDKATADDDDDESSNKEQTTTADNSQKGQPDNKDDQQNSDDVKDTVETSGGENENKSD